MTPDVSTNKNCKSKDLDVFRNQIGISPASDCLSQLYKYDISDQIELIYLIALDDLEVCGDFLKKVWIPKVKEGGSVSKSSNGTYSNEITIRLIKRMSFSGFINHLLLCCDLIELLDIFQSDLTTIIVKNKLLHFLTSVDIPVIKRVVGIIIKYSRSNRKKFTGDNNSVKILFDDAKLSSIALSLFTSPFESLRCLAVDLISYISTVDMKFLIDDMVKDSSYRVRYHLAKGILIPQHRVEESKIENSTAIRIISVLKNDPVPEIRAIVYQSPLFYSGENSTELIKQFYALFNSPEPESDLRTDLKCDLKTDLKSALFKGMIKHTDLFKEKESLIVDYILNEPWEIKRHMISSGKRDFEKYYHVILEEEVNKDLKRNRKKTDSQQSHSVYYGAEYGNILDILLLFKNTAQSAGDFGELTLNILVDLLVHRVHVIRKTAAEIIEQIILNGYKVESSGDLRGRVGDLSETKQGTEINNEMKSEVSSEIFNDSLNLHPLVISLLGKENTEKISKLRAHEKIQVRNDTERLQRYIGDLK